MDASGWEHQDYEASSLDELRDGAVDAEGRTRLARALYHACGRAYAEGQVDVYRSRRDEMRTFVASYPDESGSLEPWSLILYNDHRDAVLDAKEEAGEILSELGTVVGSPAASPRVRESFANALYNAHWSLSEVAPTPRSEAYLEGLRRLEAVTGEQAIAVHLARALFNAHHQARAFEEAPQVAALYAELADLTRKHRSEPTLLGELAKATYDNFHDAVRSGQAEVAVSLFAALGRLYTDNPEVATIREQLSRACVIFAATASERDDALERLQLAHRLNPSFEFGEATEPLRELAARTRERWGLDDLDPR